MRPLNSTVKTLAVQFSRAFRSPFAQISTRSIGLLTFFALYLIVIQTCRILFSRDPTSWFFDAETGYTQDYSSIRRHQADAFISAADASNVSHRITDPTTAKLCVGVASVARGGPRYFRTSVGSLLEGLTEDERQGLYLILFIAHTEPTVHPAYAEKWLHNVADRVLMYNLPEGELDRIRRMEKDRTLFKEKALLDYTHLLKACAQTGAPYVAMVEDDVIALDGWYHRTLEALEIANHQTRARGNRECESLKSQLLHEAYPALDLYLRLFYTEALLGWNSENWPTYLFWSAVSVSTPLLSWILLRRLYPPSKRIVPFPIVILGCCVCVPFCILLFFAIGKVSTLPLPRGVIEMSNFGCCSQSFVFPKAKAIDLIDYYESRKVGFVDELTEELADQHDEIRWALNPGVMQHIGRTSSKRDDIGMTSKHNMTHGQKLWNFAFERNDPKKLHEEHVRAANITER
ncbi:MAG: hypothetical protein M1837_002469 [Sclerophora amabilis]|nr:MAG: hypothetical protein M1837_002469 [Sclerophora amabilis]